MEVLKRESIKIKLFSFIKDTAIASVMLGLLLAFTKLIKFVVLIVQEYSSLNEQFLNEKDAINRTSKYFINTPIGRKPETSYEFTMQAEQLSSQIQSNQFLFFALSAIILIAFITLYFSIDFLIEYINRFKPWSIIILLLTFVGSVLYIEITDLRETGNGICFMFTSMISIVTGIILIGYTLIFPNYMKPKED